MRLSNRYCGQSGLYASVRPLKGFAKLRACFHDLGIDDISVDDAHCTLMYSRDSAPHVVKVGTLLAAGPYNFQAFPKEVKWWPGHDNKGYLVLELDSPALRARHMSWRELGAKHSFPDYTPHVTLAAPFEQPMKAWLNNINNTLKLDHYPLVFGGEHVEDIKS